MRAFDSVLCAHIVAEKSRVSKGTARSRQLRISYVESGVDEYSSSKKPAKEEGRSGRRSGVARSKVYPEGRAMVDRDGVGTEETKKRRNKKINLRVNASRGGDSEKGGQTPSTEASTPRTPGNVRGSRDLRSPGQKKSPVARSAKSAAQVPSIQDFVTQTDANGNATTPRSAEAIQGARVQHPSGPKPRLHISRNGKLSEEEDDPGLDPCETIIDGLRLMCCCLLPEGDEKGGRLREGATQDSADDNVDKVRLLGPHHPADEGKKCLVLDLDETLVHSSFRAVPGADFVIPVQVRTMSEEHLLVVIEISFCLSHNVLLCQIEDVVHFVYVAKRPGVDEFLVEMAKHYEIVIYTASLNKYADPLLDLLDPNCVIRSRLFRESCVYYEGNYVKDLSLLDRDLSQVIIVDNSPSSYIFHPENAIDCSSFIDDTSDRELDQIAAFLAGVKDSKDVRQLCHQWRDWPVAGPKEHPEDER